MKFTCVSANTLKDIISTNMQLIGFYGAPPFEALTSAAKKYEINEFVDLDVFYHAPFSDLIPKAYCHIIRNIADNAFALNRHLQCIVAATGKEKCDAGRYIAHVLKEKIDVEIVVTENTGIYKNNAALLCSQKGSLKKRTVKIMRSIIEPLSQAQMQDAKDNTCKPTCGFWGTPPHPIEVLDLFPETTHIFGWTKCVAEGRPWDISLETRVLEDIPIVFFSQGFCPKTALARHLAQKYNGMFVDTHDSAGAATRAKIEAFLRLSINGGKF